MERIAIQSTQAIFSSAGSARESQILMEQLVAQERQARLYEVLEDPANLKEFEQIHEKIQEIIIRLETLPFADQEKEGIKRLKTIENDISLAFTDKSHDRDRKESLEHYQELNKICRSIQSASYQLMVHEAENLKEKSARYQGQMFWFTVFLFFCSIFLISIFAFLIVGPIRQMDKGIIRLGEGDFTKPIAVSGPRDLEFLGTKLDWLRERLAELDQEKNKFIAHISHDLKTPLASIKEGADLLADEVVGPITKQQREVIKIMANNSKLLQTLIENIINFNMAQARNVPMQKHPFHLNELIEEVANDHKPMLLASNLVIVQNLQPIFIAGDKNQIRAVIDNVLFNAIKYSPANSEISISMKRQEQSVHIDIIDRGPGIDVSEKTKIFNPFYRGTTAQKGAVKGTGLGLTIAKEYMSNHKGSIELIFDTDHGAHFRLSLPVEEAS